MGTASPRRRTRASSLWRFKAWPSTRVPQRRKQRRRAQGRPPSPAVLDRARLLLCDYFQRLRQRRGRISYCPACGVPLGRSLRGAALHFFCISLRCTRGSTWARCMPGSCISTISEFAPNAASCGLGSRASVSCAAAVPPHGPRRQETESSAESNGSQQRPLWAPLRELPPRPRREQPRLLLRVSRLQRVRPK